MPDHCDDILTLRTVRAVVDALGGTNATAELLGITPPAVSLWLSNGHFPPARYLDVSAAAEKCGYRVEPALFRRSVAHAE